MSVRRNPVLVHVRMTHGCCWPETPRTCTARPAGRGMNLGIQDAVALADALGAVLAGGADSVLDEYSSARRPIAQDVVAMTERLTRLATLPRAARPVRNTAFGLAGRVPAVRRALARRLADWSIAEPY